LDDPTADVRPVPRERVEAVAHILGSGEPVHLERTPEWRSGDEPPDIGGEQS
jgi:hypothetical protein